MFIWLGRFVVRFRWWVLAAWIVAFASSGAFVGKLTPLLKTGFGRAQTESQLGLELLQKELNLSSSSLVAVFTSQDLKATDPQFLQQMEAALESVRRLEYVSGVTTYVSGQNPRMVSPDGHTTYAVIDLSLSIDKSLDKVEEVRQRLRRPDGLTVYLTGSPAIFEGIVKTTEADVQRAERITFPVVLVALLLVFGTLIAAGLPLAVGLISVSVTLALLSFIARATDVSVFALNVTTLLGLGIAIDYALLVVTRFREELEHSPPGDAAVLSVHTAGRAIFFSAITTFLGLGGLLLTRFMMLRSIGIGGMLVVALSMLVALTLLPAALSLIGTKINALRILPGMRGNGGFWSGLARWVMRHPVWVVVPVGVFLLLLGTPFLRVKLGVPTAASLPVNAEARKGWEVLEQRFGVTEFTPVLVAVQTPSDVFKGESIGALYDYTRELGRIEGVRRVESIVNLDPNLGKEQYQVLYANPQAIPIPQVRQAAQRLSSQSTTLVRVFSEYDSNSDAAKEQVARLREVSPSGDLKTYTTGATADLLDSVKVLYSDFPKTVAFVFITIYVVLLVLFRSVVLPLKAVLMNTLSIMASYGALVFIFQQGHFQGLLGFTSQGHIESVLPILMFCIVYGLSMDYEIFLLSRVKEVYDNTRDNTLSVAQGLERTGRVITSAALILVLVSGSFATGDIVTTKSVGVGIALAVFIDATIIRALLVPALMRVLGDWNWWAPAFLKRVLPGGGIAH